MITVENLSIHYGNLAAVRDVSLDIPEGKITAVVGPSGCGKSSFLASLNRLTDLIPGAKVAGEIRLNGKSDIVNDPGLDLLELRRTVGMVFQKPNPFPLSIRKNFELPLLEHGISKREIPGRIESTLREVGLWDEISDRLDESAENLSGGQQQRLCIARALALRPKVILFDEPCSALDPLASGVVEDHIAALRGKVTVVIVTHNLAQARRIADEVALFWVRDGAGCVIETGPANTIFDRPKDPDAALYFSGARG
ncbi:MAG: phosphate ABC transporter ATP-binding protein [Verrucomicrobiales bacterium]|nr:phosphate ABC transporter ATP-binding protein [Verrucomicrobiales bacterium]